MGPLCSHDLWRAIGVRACTRVCMCVVCVCKTEDTGELGEHWKRRVGVGKKEGKS